MTIGDWFNLPPPFPTLEVWEQDSKFQPSNDYNGFPGNQPPAVGGGGPKTRFISITKDTLIALLA